MSDRDMTVVMSPEDQEVAETYIGCGEDITMAANTLGISRARVSEVVKKPAVKRMIDNIFLDTGYRNRSRIGDVLDEIIESKLEEAREDEYFGNTPIIDLLKFAHQIRKDEEKTQLEREKLGTGGKLSVNHKHSVEGGDNYQSLLKHIMASDVNRNS